MKYYKTIICSIENSTKPTLLVEMDNLLSIISPDLQDLQDFQVRAFSENIKKAKETTTLESCLETLGFFVKNDACGDLSEFSVWVTEVQDQHLNQAGLSLGIPKTFFWQFLCLIKPYTRTKLKIAEFEWRNLQVPTSTSTLNNTSQPVYQGFWYIQLSNASKYDSNKRQLEFCFQSDTDKKILDILKKFEETYPQHVRLSANHLSTQRSQIILDEKNLSVQDIGGEYPVIQYKYNFPCDWIELFGYELNPRVLVVFVVIKTEAATAFDFSRFNSWQSTRTQKMEVFFIAKAEKWRVVDITHPIVSEAFQGLTSLNSLVPV